MNKKSVGSTIVSLAILSLIVGVLLKFFHISPMGLLHIIPDAIAGAFRAAQNAVSWGGEYILLGAVIVVPAYLILNITNIMKFFADKKQ